MQETTSDRFWEAELLRVRGELLLARGADGDCVEGEQSLRDAVRVARMQEAKSLELRAATSLGRALHARGQSDEAASLLSDVYGWFTEGFETADLKEAHAMLTLSRGNA
jgi:predicted ATPase